MKKIAKALVGAGIVATLSFAGSLPNYKSLCGELGKIEGWTLTKCEGMSMVNPMMGEVVTAAKTYTKGEKRLNVSVISGMQAMMMWAPYSAGTQMENDEVLVKIENIDGCPVGISYDKKEKTGGIVVQLRPNAVLVVEFERMGWKEALEMAKKFDWKKLKALFE